jgi:hypothetical protein
MPYFSELLVRNGRLLTNAVILTETGEARHQDEVSALSPTQWRPNYAIRGLCQYLSDNYENDLDRIREESVGFDKQTFPNELACPVSMNLFDIPVIAEDGHTYEEEVILEWVRTCEERQVEISSPVCRCTISRDGLIPNALLISVLADAIEQRRVSLQSEQPDITRGIGKISVEEILERFRIRRRSYYLPVDRLAKEASAQSAEARQLSAEGYLGQGSQVHQEASHTGSRVVDASSEASAQSTTDFSVTVMPGLFSRNREGGGGGKKEDAKSSHSSLGR